MVADRIVYFLFTWGRFFIDASISIIDKFTTPFGELYPDSVLNFLFLGMSLVLDPLCDVLGFDLLTLSPLDLLIGPGMAFLFFLLIYRLIKP